MTTTDPRPDTLEVQPLDRSAHLTLEGLRDAVETTLAEQVQEQTLTVSGFVDGDIEAMARTLHGLRQLRFAVAIVEKQAEDALANAMQTNQVPAGPFACHRRWSTPKEVWDDPMVAGALSQSIATTEDGEHDAGLAATLERGFAELLACAAPRWRKGALRERNIDPDKYCAREGQGHFTVQVDLVTEDEG